MAPKYKLTYFNIRGAAEVPRFLFAYGDIEYEDVRIDENDWPHIKPNMPFGQLPVLEVNGKIVNQSKSIARYIAKQVKLYGNDDWEDLEIDAIVDTFHDIMKPFIALRFESDEAKRKEKYAELVKTTLPYYVDRLEAIVKKNGGFLVGNRITLADISFAVVSENLMSRIGNDMLNKYPNLVELRDKVFAIPNIKKWVETRPKTER